MPEQSPNPERRAQGPEYEIDLLVELNEIATELYEVARENHTKVRAGYLGSDEPLHSPSDVILDGIQELALAMVRRQGVKFGKALYEKLWERADSEGEDAPRGNEAEQHRNLAIAVDRQLFNMGVGLGAPEESTEG